MELLKIFIEIKMERFQIELEDLLCQNTSTKKERKIN